jgi:phage terminase large subunit
MTRAKAAEIQRRTHPGRPRKEPIGFARRIVILCRSEITVQAGERIRWPASKYRDDPVGFARDILGVDPWSKQIEILEALRDHARLAVRSGHKVSKSHSMAIAALWFVSSWPDARVVMTSTTSRQVDAILWLELSKLVARGGRCLVCKAEYQSMLDTGVHQLDADERIPKPCPHSSLILQPGDELGRLAKTGLKTADFRDISGFTAKQAEGVAGISGKNLLYLVDEASGVPDEIFEAIEGNRAGGARIGLFSNPTRTDGEFFEAFHKKAELYHCIRVSSADTPNVVEGRVVIPGLAEREWIEEKKREWGETSPQYKVRVEGEFPVGEDGRIFTLQAILDAERRWEDAEADGRLNVGFDPSGEAGTGDEMALCPRRGMRALRIDVHRGLDEYAALLTLLELLAELRNEGEIPAVKVDAEGDVGAKTLRAMREYEAGCEPGSKLREFLDEHPAHPLRNFIGAGKVLFDIVVVRASERSRANKSFHRLRDRLCGELADWIRAGGAIPEDVKLSAELHVLVWSKVDDGPLQLLSKLEIRKILGRSPDRYDALALAVWEPMWIREEETAADSAPQPLAARSVVVDDDSSDDRRGGQIDPYSGAIDPYG